MTDMCLVGCKLPHGLKVDLPGMDAPITLKGANAARVMGGYGITKGIPRESFRKWLRANAKRDFVMNGSVFMVDDEKSARSRAAEGRDEKTGFEAMDPSKPPSGIVMDDDAKKALAKQVAENPDRNRQHDELDE